MASTLQAPGEFTASLLGRPGPRHASITLSLRSRLRGPGCKTHPRHVGTVGASDSLSGASVNPPFKWDHSPDPWAGEGPLMSWVGARGQGPGVGGSQRAGGVLCLGSRDHRSGAGAWSGRGRLASVLAALALSRASLLSVGNARSPLLSAGLWGFLHLFWATYSRSAEPWGRVLVEGSCVGGGRAGRVGSAR